jgi:ubiquinone/menaquinone biosynthesis C-methylase UbiE
MSILEKKRLHYERKILFENIQGKVMELGSGTGVNFEFYKDNEVIAIEPDEILSKKAKIKAENKNIKIIVASAEELPFEDNTFDTIIVTLSLCTISNPEKALKEANRVCKANGRLLILEHIKNKKRFLFMLQNILTPIWKKFAMGCNLNRDTLLTIKNSNFEEVSLKYFWGNNFVSGVFKNIK